MKKLFALSIMFILSACTISDTYYLPDVGVNNVGSAVGVYEEDDNGRVEFRSFSGKCEYFLGIRLTDDCSPTKIANKYDLKTITEQNTLLQLWPFVLVQKTIIAGIPYDNKD